jgi:hypothetical protein
MALNNRPTVDFILVEEKAGFVEGCWEGASVKEFGLIPEPVSRSVSAWAGLHFFSSYNFNYFKLFIPQCCCFLRNYDQHLNRKIMSDLQATDNMRKPREPADNDNKD